MITSAPTRHWLVGALVAGLLVLAGGATAQHVELPGGIGRTPVITPVPTIMPTITPSLTTPSLAPSVTPTLAPPAALNPTLAAPAAMPAPAPVARSVRFRCEVLPQDQSCREHSEPPDGDAHDDKCDCTRDYCYPAPNGNRICEKLQ